MNNEIRYAGFWLRFLATIIDTAWLYTCVYIALWFLIGPDIFNPEKSVTFVQIIFEWIVPFFVIISFWIIKAATPGKMLLKMKIVCADTFKPVPPRMLILRYFAYFISAIPFCLGYFWVIWDKRKQGWHDKIASTIVIRY